MRILGVIPARGGSKGIPNKNKKELLGKPLMQYTIESALAATKLNALVFSSENESLISLAETLAVDVPFKRPKRLATDDAGTLEVLQFTVTELAKKGEYFDAVCLLQVTNPFRTSKFIDQAIKKFKQSNTDSLISVLEVPHEYNPHWVFKTNAQENLELVIKNNSIIKRRQELPKTYFRDGSIYITKTRVLLEKKSLYGDSIAYIEADEKRHVNIDTMDDWLKAEILAENLDK